jgi:hypothetical protein
VTIAAGPSGAGKTTLLTALLRDIPADRSRVFTRGFHHPVADIERDAGRTTLIVNEISPHLPIYAWGDVLRAVLATGRHGAQVLATTHAATPEELVFQLASYPLRLPPDFISALGSVAFIQVEECNGRQVRRLGLVVKLASDRGGVRLDPFREDQNGRLDWRVIASIVGEDAEHRHRLCAREIERAIEAIEANEAERGT